MNRTKKIKLRDGHVVIVDAADHKWLTAMNWHPFRISGTGQQGKVYYYGHKALCYVKGKRCWMHNVIIKPPPGMEVDHRDGDPLNNTRKNLRVVTHAENCYNRGKQNLPHATSKYMGVSWHTARKTFAARAAGKWVGYFKSEIDAARAADAAVLARYGDKGRMNFPRKAAKG